MLFTFTNNCLAMDCALEMVHTCASYYAFGSDDGIELCKIESLGELLDNLADRANRAFYNHVGVAVPTQDTAYMYFYDTNDEEYKGHDLINWYMVASFKCVNGTWHFMGEHENTRWFN